MRDLYTEIVDELHKEFPKLTRSDVKMLSYQTLYSCDAQIQTMDQAKSKIIQTIRQLGDYHVQTNACS